MKLRLLCIFQGHLRPGLFLLFTLVSYSSQSTMSAIQSVVHCCCWSVTVSCLTPQPHGLQHVRLPWPLLTLEFAQTHVHWVGDAYHSTISSSVSSFSFCLQSFPELGSFPVSRLFTSGGQSIGASASASVLPVNIQGWFPLGLTGLIFLLSKGLSRVFSSTTVQKHKFFSAQPCFMVQLSHPYMTTGKTVPLTIRTFISKVAF